MYFAALEDALPDIYESLANGNITAEEHLKEGRNHETQRWIKIAEDCLKPSLSIFVFRVGTKDVTGLKI